MRFLLALTLAAAACTGDPPAPPADAAPDAAPDADPCASAGQPCGCRTGPGVTQGSLRCVGGGLVCDCVAAPDAAPDVEMDAATLDAAPEAGPDAAADAGIDEPSGDAPADANATCETRCDGACVDAGFDPFNCGACGVRCMAPAPHTRAQCFAGRCETPCEDGYQNCNSTLSDGCETYVLGSDRANCGSCRGTCAPSAICVAGRCRTP